jgi:hypothetical protein
LATCELLQSTDGLVAHLSAIEFAAATILALTVFAQSQPPDIPAKKLMDRGAMQQVCENNAAVNIDSMGHFQCTVCPSYTDLHGTRESFSLRAAYRGHFSTTKADQLLLALNGCEPHASGFGGSILLTRDGTVWKKSGYFKGDNVSNCLPFKSHDGLDRLACLAGDSFAGNSVYWMSAASYRNNSLHEERLLDASSNLTYGSPVARYCYDQHIGTFEKLPSGIGYRVVVTQTRGLAPSDGKSCGETEIPMEPPQTVNLNFQFDGEHFTLAPESKDSLQRVQNFVPHQ